MKNAQEQSGKNGAFCVENGKQNLLRKVGREKLHRTDF
jgi:hypothetical protein